jgi:chromosomal replication initiation ATPase DnaA
LDQIKKAVDSSLPTKKLARQIKLYSCHRYSGRKLSEIGKRFGIGLSGVIQASRQIGLKVKKGEKARQSIKKNRE